MKRIFIPASFPSWTSSKIFVVGTVLLHPFLVVTNKSWKIQTIEEPKSRMRIWHPWSFDWTNPCWWRYCNIHFILKIVMNSVLFAFSLNTILKIRIKAVPLYLSRKSCNASMKLSLLVCERLSKSDIKSFTSKSITRSREWVS